jgi:hypothetical protein
MSVGIPGQIECAAAHMRGWVTNAMLVGVLRVDTSRSASSLVRTPSRTMVPLGPITHQRLAGPRHWE